MISCSDFNNIGYKNNTGLVKIKFEFPKKFSIKAIPTNTEKIIIKIYGEGLPKDIEKIIEKNSDKTLVIEEVPIGKKTIDIRALDKDNNVLAKATSDTVVEGGKTNQVKIELLELLQDLKIRLENLPSDSDTNIIEVIGSNKQIKVNEFKGNEVTIKDIPSGKASIRISSFDKNAFPLSKGSKEIDVNKETKFISLSSVKIPNLSEFDENSLKPKDLFSTLDEIMINSPSNKKPVITNLRFEINGRQISEPPIVPSAVMCVKTGDKLKVTLNIRDDNDDSVSVFWGVISRLDSSKLSFQLLQEKSKEINYSVDFNSGSHSLGFLVSDKKSYSIPSALYFKICN